MTNTGLDPDDAPDWLAQNIGVGPVHGFDVLAGIADDDCAVLESQNQILIFTSDYVNATPILLQLRVGTFYDLGKYLVNSNLSDLCGSGARPIAIVTSIMWRRDEPRISFEDLMHGARSAADEAGAIIAGGDTKLSTHPAFCATAIGVAASRSELLLKSRAEAGDGVWVSGPLGSCAAAVLGWHNESMTAAWREWAKQAIVNPKLPLETSRHVATLRMNASGTDLSDGLGADLTSLCDTSSVGVEIYADSIPVSDEVAALANSIGTPPHRMAFTVGGDLQFLITASENWSNELSRLGMTRIGTVHGDPSRRRLIGTLGEHRKLPSNGHRDAHSMTFVQEVRYLLHLMDTEC